MSQPSLVRPPAVLAGPGSVPADEARRLVVALARALHRYGTPAHRIEATLARVSEALGERGQFFSTPTAIFASFGDDADQRSILVRAEPGEVHLAKLTALDEILKDVVRGRIDATEARARVEALADASLGYAEPVLVLAATVASGAAARFFGGGWREMLVAAGIGLLLGLLASAARRGETLGRVYEPLGALLAAATAVGLAHAFGHVSTYVATLAGLIVLLPGLTVTTALNELATRHLVSGTARLAGAGAMFVAIGFGVALGTRLMTGLLGDPGYTEPVPLPAWTEWIAVLAAPVGISLLFQAPLRDAPWTILSGLVAFFGARLGAALFGPELGVFLAALLVGLGSNLYARVLDRPASIPLIPGIMLLVPGSIGFSSLFSLLADDLVSGMDAAFTMTLVAVALVTGLLVAHVVLPPRRTL